MCRFRAAILIIDRMRPGALAVSRCWWMPFIPILGVTIDGCFEVDLAGFRSIVDILDGVDVTLTAREAEAWLALARKKSYII